jgi:hypothetical protein
MTNPKPKIGQRWKCSLDDGISYIIGEVTETYSRLEYIVVQCNGFCSVKVAEKVLYLNGYNQEFDEYYWDYLEGQDK